MSTRLGSRTYLLASSSAELERLQLQAGVWEPAAVTMLDQIGVEPGWRCADLGCGAMGVVGPLGRAVGPGGSVVGVDCDPMQLGVARTWAAAEGLSNVTMVEGDAYATGLPREDFDLTHVRFLFAPVGRDAELLEEMLALTKPGGVVAIQEPDAVSWRCAPESLGWDRLRDVILQAYRDVGGDFNAGRRMYAMLRHAGLEDVEVRARVLALPPGHPYRRLPVQFAGSLRGRILESGLLRERELDEAIADCLAAVANPDVVITTFLLMQVWGRKPRT